MGVSALTIPGVEVPPLSCRLHDNVWGFDVSTRRISVGVIQGRGMQAPPEVGWFSRDVAQHNGGAVRLAGLLEDLPLFLQPIARAAPPSAVLVEQPYGQGKARPHPQSYYIVGVVLAVLATQFPGPVAVVEPTSWKAEALGAGAGFAKKPQILAWARSVVGYSGDCPKCHGDGSDACDNPCRAHDEADGIGVATAGAIRWSRDHRLR